MSPSTSSLIPHQFTLCVVAEGLLHLSALTTRSFLAVMAPALITTSPPVESQARCGSLKSRNSENHEG